MAEYSIQGNVKKQPLPEPSNQMSKMEHNVQDNVKKQPLPESAHQMSRMENIEHSNVRKQQLPETANQISRMQASGIPARSMPMYREQTYSRAGALSAANAANKHIPTFNAPANAADKHIPALNASTNANRAAFSN